MTRIDPRRLFSCWLCFLALGGSDAVPGQAAEPAQKPARQEALERFRKMSPAARLQWAEKVAGKDQAFAPAKRADLAITLVERGTLEATDVADVVCRVKAPEGKGKVATTIKWVVDDGTPVKKGQRLVELDDSALRDQLRLQKIALEQAQTDEAEAAQALKILRKQNQLDLTTAEISLRLARLALKKSDDADVNEVLQLKVKQAQLRLELVTLQSNAKVNRAEADVKASTTRTAKEAQRVSDLEAQVAACILTAPQAGRVLYYIPEQVRFGRGSEAAVVAQGEPVREGQKLLRVSNLKHFALVCRVHEALVAQVRPGQKAVVQIDAFPRQVFHGTVKTVGTVASRQAFRARDVKLYPVVVDLADPLPSLRPGLSAEVRIEEQRRPKVVQVRVGAVLRSERTTFCYVRVGKELQERTITTGLRNDQFIEVKAGLKEGEIVLQAPRTVAGMLAPRRSGSP